MYHLPLLKAGRKTPKAFVNYVNQLTTKPSFVSENNRLVIAKTPLSKRSGQCETGMLVEEQN